MKALYKGKEFPIKLRAGDVVVFHNNFIWSRPATYLSTAIRIATKFPYNHSAIITESNGQLYINEAIGKGIVKRPLSEGFLQRKSTSFCAVLRPVIPMNIEDVSIEADRHLGKEYDVTALVVHHLLYRLTHHWIGSTNQFATKKLVCSEYVQLVYKRPNFWKASTKEVVEDPFYKIIYEEIPLLNK